MEKLGKLHLGHGCLEDASKSRSLSYSIRRMNFHMFDQAWPRQHDPPSLIYCACMNVQLSARCSLTYTSENPPISFPIILSFQSQSTKMKVKGCSFTIMSLFCVCLNSKCLKFVSPLCPLKQMTISVSFVLVLGSHLMLI